MIYEAIKGAIKAKGMTMEYLSIKMGMSRPTLQGRLEQPKSMTISEVEKLSELLGIGKDVLIN